MTREMNPNRLRRTVVNKGEASEALLTSSSVCTFETAVSGSAS
jgi:hypothetical protein